MQEKLEVEKIVLYFKIFFSRNFFDNMEHCSSYLGYPLLTTFNQVYQRTLGQKTISWLLLASFSVIVCFFQEYVGNVVKKGIQDKNGVPCFWLTNLL